MQDVCPCFSQDGKPNRATRNAMLACKGRNGLPCRMGCSDKAHVVFPELGSIDVLPTRPALRMTHAPITFSPRNPPLVGSVQEVVAVCAKKEVVWIYTAGVIATVAHK